MKDKEFPCGTCCENDMSCCHNPQITWSIEEFDRLLTEYPDIMKKIIILKAELPGFIYVLDKEIALNPDKNNDINLEYCVFYDIENQNCGVYDHRPSICSTYGDPKYNACPYEGMSDVQLVDLIRNNRKAAMQLHKTAFSDPMTYVKDYIEPFVTLFMNSDPAYIEWWTKLPSGNFVRQ